MKNPIIAAGERIERKMEGTTSTARPRMRAWGLAAGLIVLSAVKLAVVKGRGKPLTGVLC